MAADLDCRDRVLTRFVLADGVYEALQARLRERPILVVPGFVGRHEDGRLSLLGRGGSDLTALFLAARLGGKCRLLKDVPVIGVFMGACLLHIARSNHAVADRCSSER